MFLLQNHTTKCGGETIARLFFKQKKMRISLDEVHKFVFSLLSLYVQVKG